MKKHLVLLLVSIAIAQCAYSQTDKSPHNAAEAIRVPETKGIVTENAETPVATVPPGGLPEINGKFNIGIQINCDGKASTGLITITQNGKPFKSVESKGLKYLFALDLNSNYLVKCTKPGYITKTVFIDTKIPAGRESQGFAKFTAIVTLFKDDGKTKASDKPVGKILYSIERDDFDYDKDYK